MSSAWVVSAVTMVAFGSAWVWTLRSLLAVEKERDAIWDEFMDLWDRVPVDARVTMIAADREYAAEFHRRSLRRLKSHAFWWGFTHPFSDVRRGLKWSDHDESPAQPEG